jgi:hypothetical protein
MRFIPTPGELVERLKKQAKKLQRSGAGKHSDLLNRVAKQAGYDHWHHVIICSEIAAAVSQMRTIRGECEAVVAAELRGDVKIVVTKPGPACPPFVLFSTGVGDAWLLEPDEQLAMYLLWHGEREVIGVSEDPARIEVAWDGGYELLGDFFHVQTTNQRIGERAIGGYPLGAVRKALDGAQSTVSKMASVMGQHDAVDIDDQVVAQMIKKGWSEAEVLKLKADGYRYSPWRDSLLGPIMSSDDIGDLDKDEADHMGPN